MEPKKVIMKQVFHSLSHGCPQDELCNDTKYTNKRTVSFIFVIKGKVHVIMVILVNFQNKFSTV